MNRRAGQRGLHQMLFFLQNPDAPVSTPKCFTPLADTPSLGGGASPVA